VIEVQNPGGGHHLTAYLRTFVENFDENRARRPGSFDKISDKGPITHFWDQLYYSFEPMNLPWACIGTKYRLTLRMKARQVTEEPVSSSR
jgi:hypothetical protein